MDGVRRLVDAALEISVVGSFSRIGPAIRRRLDRWTAPPSTALAGRTVLVTGPTSGLGLATTRALGSAGRASSWSVATRVGCGRSARMLTAVHGEARFPIVVADMGSLASVRAAVDRILATETRLDVVVDNAGAIFAERRRRPRRHRGDVRAAGRRPVRSGRWSAAAAASGPAAHGSSR